MAPKDKKGKAIDQTTKWSDWQWDEQTSNWYATRYNSQGKIEYTTSKAHDGDNSQDARAIPRTPEPEGVQDIGYMTPIGLGNSSGYPADPNSTYTTTIPAAHRGFEYIASPQVSEHSTAGSYDNVNSPETVQNSRGGSYLTPDSWPTPRASTSASHVQYPYANIEDHDLRESNQDLNSLQDYHGDLKSTEDPSQAFQNLSLNSLPTASRSAYSTTSYQQDDAGNIYASADVATVAELNSRYKVIDSKHQKKFWKVGRVFLVLWTEPARNTGGVSSHSGQCSNSSQVSDTFLGGKAFTEIRRFVIVQEGYGNAICCPVHTYGGQATLKPNLPEAQQHAIIYTSDWPPDEYWYTATDGSVVREELSKDPIKVKREQKGPEGDLGTGSRINYCKVYTIEHYVRVLNIGMVEDRSLPTLLHNSIVRRESAIEKPRNNPPRSRKDDKKDSRRDKGKGRAT